MLVYKRMLAFLIFTLLQLLSYAFNNKLLSFISVFPAIYIVITLFQIVMEE